MFAGLTFVANPEVRVRGGRGYKCVIYKCVVRQQIPSSGASGPREKWVCSVMHFCFKETLGMGFASGCLLSPDGKMKRVYPAYPALHPRRTTRSLHVRGVQLWHGSEKVTQMLQLILDLLQGITPLPVSAWTRFIFFIKCIKKKSMKKKNRWCEACLLLACK